MHVGGVYFYAGLYKQPSRWLDELRVKILYSLLYIYIPDLLYTFLILNKISYHLMKINNHIADIFLNNY